MHTSDMVTNNRPAGGVVWLTGLSGSGKSTVSAELECRLLDLGRPVWVLDGDKVREGLCSDLGFSHEHFYATQGLKHLKGEAELDSL